MEPPAAVVEQEVAAEEAQLAVACLQVRGRNWSAIAKP
jgi:hypothetical protein